MPIVFSKVFLGMPMPKNTTFAGRLEKHGLGGLGTKDSPDVESLRLYDWYEIPEII